jgi:putative ABC transport system permease protein
MQDLRFTLRLMRKRPGSTSLIVLALVLGVAVNSAIFSVVNVALIRPWPFKDYKRLFYIQTQSPTSPGFSVSYPDFLDWKKQSHSFVEMTAARRFNFNLTGRESPSLLAGNMVSANFFRVLGVPMLLGRDFQEDDDRLGANRVVILGYAMWGSTGKDPDILGKTLILNDELYTVIGVAPPSQVVQQSAVWMPIGLFANQELLDRNHRFCRVIARLAPGVTPTQAQTEMDNIARGLASDYPVSNSGYGVRVVQIYQLYVGGNRTPYVLVLMASLLILIMACVNVATAHMTGIMQRQNELSIRLALGASRLRLLRQMFIEFLLLATFSALAGTAVAYVTVKVMAEKYAFLSVGLSEIKIDPLVIWFTILAAILATIFTYIVPGAFAINVKIANALKGQPRLQIFGKFRSAAGAGLIVLQVSVALALCLCSGLLIKSFYRVVETDLGYEPETALLCFMSPPPVRYPDQDKVTQLYERIVSTVRTMPGVKLATVISRPPLTGAYNMVPIEFTNTVQSPSAGARPVVDVLEVLPQYFATLQIPLLQGRDFTEHDRKGEPMVAIVDDVLAAKTWPKESALGKRLRLADPGDVTAPWLEVVGVVKQVKQYGPEQPVPRMQVYIPIAQEKHSAPIVALAVRFDPHVGEDNVRVGIRNSVATLDSKLWLNSFETLDWLYHLAEGRRKVSVALLTSFAALGILLGFLGISGAVSSSIVRRRRELAIRIALGSTRSQATVNLLKWTLVCVGLGLLLGAFAVMGAKKILTSFLFGVAPLDGTVFIWAIFLVVLLALVATLIPARSILRLDPQEVLHEE